MAARAVPSVLKKPAQTSLNRMNARLAPGLGWDICRISIRNLL